MVRQRKICVDYKDVVYGEINREPVILLVKRAYDLAKQAYKGQRHDYINHPVAVAAMLDSDEEKTVALLHDVVEDTTITIEELGRQFTQEIIEAVDCITKRVGEPHEKYMERISKNKLATKVKLADMTHNSDITRIENPTGRDIERVRKYKERIEYLKRFCSVFKINVKY